VSYGKLWRTGAGNCTLIKFSRPVVVGDNIVNKGTYSVFTIPNTHEWTIILNADTTLYGESGYDSKKDVARINAKTRPSSRYHESLTIDIDVKPNNAIIYITWENTEVAFAVETDTDKAVTEFIKQNLMTDKSSDPEEYATAAEYYYFLGKDLDRALVLIDKAIKRKNASWYYRQKIDILAMQMKYQEAIDCATLAISLDSQRSDWDTLTKQRSKEGYIKRIALYERKMKK
jgi:tetratricopeptide (TPR) repeat protein